MDYTGKVGLANSKFVSIGECDTMCFPASGNQVDGVGFKSELLGVKF
jgi:hypothetical protein